MGFYRVYIGVLWGSIRVIWDSIGFIGVIWGLL